MTEAHSTPKMKNIVPLAFLLDVDGVITNPTEKKVTEEALFGFLETNLIMGNPVALNTGRSNEWMIERVINPLSERLKDKTILKNFFAVGEKGLTWASFTPEGKLIQGVFDREGGLQEGFDLSLVFDKETKKHFVNLEEKARRLIEGNYSHSTFFDATKKAMVSLEMNDNFDHAKFKTDQVKFTAEIEEIVRSENLENIFRIDPSNISTDIQLKTTGKHLGARRILDWLKSKNVNPKHFITVGDSSSDLEMADELNLQGKLVDFYYVNPKKKLSVEKPYPIHTSKAEFGNGTLEVFKSIV